MKKTFFTIAGALSLFSHAQHIGREPQISAVLPGQSFHYTTFGGVDEDYPNSPNNFSSFSGGTWTKVEQSGARFMRIGGNSYNTGEKTFNAKPPTDRLFYYVAMIDECRRNNSEPVLTIPFDLNKSQASMGLEPSAGDTAFTNAITRSINNGKAMLTTINKVHKRQVKYIIIGNEPGIDYGWDGLSSQVVADNIAEYTRQMSQAFKEFDPSLRIIGPEYEFFRTGVMTRLFDPNNSTAYIGGVISSGLAAGLPYIDFASFHAYLYDFTQGPNSGMNFMEPQVSPDSWTGNRDLVYTEFEKYLRVGGDPAGKRLRGAMRQIREICNTVTQARGSSRPLGWMVTEANPTHDNESGNGSLTGMDARSMMGGQNLARMYALAMEYGCTALMMWSVKEGSGTPQDRGYLDAASGDRRPSYWHFKAIATNFKGKFLDDENLRKWLTNQWMVNELTAEPDQSWMHFTPSDSNAFNFSALVDLLETKAFACKGTDIHVMLLNHSLTDKPFVIRLDAGHTFPNNLPQGCKKFSFDAGISANSQYVEHLFSNSTPDASSGLGVIEGQSSLLLTFSCAGELKYRRKYTLAEAADETKDFQVVNINNSIPPNSITTSTAINTAGNYANANNCINGRYTSIAVSHQSGASYLHYKLPSATPIFLSSTGSTPKAEQGVYKTVVSGGLVCPNTAIEVATVVHQKSPLVDAGFDKATCTGAVTIGNAELPSSQAYQWQNQNSTKVITVNSSNTPQNTNFTMTASADNCLMSDEAHVVSGNVPELVIKDYPNDVGIEPNFTPAMFGNSHDMWNRIASNTTPVDEPIIFGSQNYYKVRVHNLGCTASVSNAAKLSLYYTKATTIGTWASQWTNFSCSQLYNNCTTGACGGQLTESAANTPGPMNLPAIAAGGNVIAEIPFTPPSYACIPSKNSMYALSFLAHVDHLQDALDPQNLSTSPYDQAIERNNVAWKNRDHVQVGTNLGGLVNIGYYSIHPNFVEFVMPGDANGESLFEHAVVRFHLSADLAASWRDGGRVGEGVVEVTDSILEITSPNSYIGNILIPNANYLMNLYPEIIPIGEVDMTGGQAFELNLIQKNGQNTTTIVGGFQYIVDKDTWECEECEFGNQSLSGSMQSSQAYSNDTLYFTSNYTIGNSTVMHLNRVVALFAEGAKLIVAQGGKLIIANSQLMGNCKGKKWEGIEIAGTTNAANCLTVTNSFIKNARHPLILTKASGVKLSHVSILGNDSGSAIYMKKVSDFEFEENSFARFENGIHSEKTIDLGAARIEKNKFIQVHTGIKSFKDDFSSLELKCNHFDYSAFAFECDSSLLNNVGTVAEGAGNKFVTNSSLANNKLRHNHGNSPTYYAGAADSVLGDVSINLVMAENESSCFNSGESARRANATSSLETDNAAVVNELQFKLVPNPSNGQITVYYQLKSGDAILTLTGLEGTIMDMQALSSEKDHIHLNYENFAAGLYIVTISGRNSEIILREKIVIVK